MHLCQGFRKSRSSDLLDCGKTDLKPRTYSHPNSVDVPRSPCRRPFGTYKHPCWVLSPAGRNRHYPFRKFTLVPAFFVWQSSGSRRFDHGPGIFVKVPAFPFERNFRLVAFAGEILVPRGGRKTLCNSYQTRVGGGREWGVGGGNRFLMISAPPKNFGSRLSGGVGSTFYVGTGGDFR